MTTLGFVVRLGEVQKSSHQRVFLWRSSCAGRFLACVVLIGETKSEMAMDLDGHPVLKTVQSREPEGGTYSTYAAKPEKRITSPSRLVGHIVELAAKNPACEQ